MEEEIKKLVERHSAVLYTPMQEWIAESLDQNPAELFNDYDVDANSDVIGYMVKDTHYITYVVPSCELDSQVNPDLADDNYRKSVGIVLAMIPHVFQAVMKNISNANVIYPLLRPQFNLEKFAFELVLHSDVVFNYVQSIRDYQVCRDEEDEEDDEDGSKALALERISTYIKSLDQTTINDHTELIKNTVLKKVYLHIVAEEGIDEEIGTSRLPEFGLTYQDVDEESYIDKLKKEV